MRLDEAVSIAPFSAADFRRRATIVRDELNLDPYGDHRFNPGRAPLVAAEKLRNAAVLIGVVDRPDEATVILTKRAETLRSHTGQVAFPGGGIDTTDASPESAALREADEEIGLRPADVEVIGRIPDYVSGSGYRIAPVLAIVRPGVTLAINPAEVDTAFEVPLSFLMDAANHQRKSRFWGKEEWFFYEMPYGGQRIWGVTAGIIRMVYERLYT